MNLLCLISFPEKSRMRSSTALLLFTRTASQEAAAKKFVRSDKTKSEKVSQRLIQHSLRQVQQSGLPYFVISPEKQRGNSFSERFTNAIEEVFAKGYQHVIAIGSDAPQITAGLLVHAAGAMEQSSILLGPDKRGGIYLLGISSKSYCRKTLLGFRWNSADLFSDFIEWKNNCNVGCAILPILKDVNGEGDLHSLLQQKSIGLQLLNALLRIIAACKAVLIPEIIFLKNLSVQNNIGRRGPPMPRPSC
jgi:glycosyltransferase A (GT-A) superfamily protein (DUF2064 family)